MTARYCLITVLLLLLIGANPEALKVIILQDNSYLKDIAVPLFGAWFGAWAAFKYQSTQKEKADFEQDQTELYLLVRSMVTNVSVFDDLYKNRIEPGIKEFKRVKSQENISGVNISGVNAVAICFRAKGFADFRLPISGKKNRYLMDISIDAAAKIDMLEQSYLGLNSFLDIHYSLSKEFQDLESGKNNYALPDQIKIFQNEQLKKVLEAGDVLIGLESIYEKVVILSAEILKVAHGYILNVKPKLNDQRFNQLEQAIIEAKTRFN